MDGWIDRIDGWMGDVLDGSVRHVPCLFLVLVLLRLYGLSNTVSMFLVVVGFFFWFFFWFCAVAGRLVPVGEGWLFLLGDRPG